jgi:AbiJ-like protein
MAIFDLHSKRQKKLRGEVPDVYVYDTFPNPFRVQVVHIWGDTLGSIEEYGQGKVLNTYKVIVDALCREYGLFQLRERNSGWNYFAELADFFLNEGDPAKVLDILEIAFRAVDRLTRDYWYLGRQDADARATAGIDELNQRFKEHGLGYEYIDCEIIRVDSEFVRAEVIKPALTLLHTKEFSGAQVEFLKAHEHLPTRTPKRSANREL